jgi:patatin-like phospholipase/acyl hydrolase
MKYGTATILSIDGGGVRGIIAARIVQDLMRRIRFLQLQRWHRSRLSRSAPQLRRPDEVFDFFAGTSSGALVVLGMVQPDPVSPEDITALFRRKAKEIFPPSKITASSAVKQAFAAKYDAAPLERVFYDMYGDIRLGECQANTLIAAYDTDHRSPFYFKNYSPRLCAAKPELCREGSKYRDFRLRDVARATTAAPTYFEPAHIVATDGKHYTLMDGGLVANNPALSAYVEARKIYRDARQYVIVSIGTGRSSRMYHWEEIRKWGYLDWVSPFNGSPINAMFTDGQSESVAHSLRQLPRVTYFRLNADLPNTVNEEMDDSREENMEAIEHMARQTIRQHREELHRIALLLYKHRRL